jgi:hypothetical protein
MTGRRASTGRPTPRSPRSTPGWTSWRPSGTWSRPARASGATWSGSPAAACSGTPWEVGLHSRDQGDAERIANLALSQGGAAALLAEGATEDELGLTALRQVAARRLAVPRQWWWTYRVRIAVR